MKILVVDDEVVSRTFLWEQLRRLGHDVVTASDGRQAWHLLEQERVSAVITDWVMPEMDGLALCRLIRAQKAAPYIYILVLTVKEGMDSYLEAMAAGADDFVTKPPDPRELEARLTVAQRVLALRGEVRTLERLLAICAYCKRIREADGTWAPIEVYIERRATLSHGVCPACYENEVRPAIEQLKASAPRPPAPPAAG